MEYQLIIKMHEDTLTYDEIILTENKLIDFFGEAIVDGHDRGSGEINFFLLTDQPERVFEKAREMFPKRCQSNLKSAFRQPGADEYKILHPKDLSKFSLK